MFLEELIGDIQLESNTIECKIKLNRENIVSWLKTVSGFANAQGGKLYVGVEDDTNKLIGFTRKEVDQERNYFNNQVNEHLFPRPRMTVRFLRYVIKDKERFILEVEVFESEIKPILLKYNNIPSIFIRRDGFTNGATYEEIIEMSIRSKNVQYDCVESDKEFDFDHFWKLRKFYSEHNDGNELSKKRLSSMGFYNENNKLMNGALFFEDDYEGKKTEIQCSVFSGLNRGSQRIITINRFNGNILDTIQNAYEFINLRMNHSLLKLDNTRINIDAYPKRALFEGIVNAVAHRDYYLDGTQIQVDMFKDRLEISSPGSFYRGVPIEKTYDLSSIISKRRNELITSVFVSCNVMEAAGTGFDKIVEDYKQADEKHRPYIFSASDHFTLVLPDLTYEEGVEEARGPSLVFVPPKNSSDYDRKILEYCYLQARMASQIAKYLDVTDSTYFRKKILENLVTQGYLEKSKLSRANYFKTNREMVCLE